MNQEHIEKAYQLIIENVHRYETDLATHFYDALIEQNVAYVKHEGKDTVIDNNDAIRALKLTAKEWQRTFQFVLLKGSKENPLQANHQLTPDAIGLLIDYMIEVLKPQTKLSLLEMGSGTGNLARTLLSNLTATDISYRGLEVDELLIDLAASISDVVGSGESYSHADAVRPLQVEAADVVLSDLPIGFYPDDAVASRYHVAAKEGHTYAHHLLMEQGLKYLKDDGVAIFLAPLDLLTSDQSDLLKAWLKDYAHVAAVITLPENLFQGNPKALFILNKGSQTRPTFAYPITDLGNADTMREFAQNFRSAFQ
jgi:site-specific DNA-methyltransferase (adenine-specific)